MGERKGVNKYYPPDYDPKKGGLNAYHGTHALRERARKLHEGILIIRFEMPYNIWCGGCGIHIGMGVRYNAQKRRMGNYYSTPIYKFRMKCHLCDQHFEIQTDPQNCDYKILSGARRKEERWDTEKAGNVQSTDRDVKEKLMTNAMYKLEHGTQDKSKARKKAPTLTRLEEMRDTWKDDFALNQIVRKKFRMEKKDIADQKSVDDGLKLKASLPDDLELVEERSEDRLLANKIKYGDDNLRPDLLVKQNTRKIKQSSIFGPTSNSKVELAKRLSGSTSGNRKRSSSESADLTVKSDALGIKLCKNMKDKRLSTSTPTENYPFDNKDLIVDFNCSTSSSSQHKRLDEPSARAASNECTEKPSTSSSATFVSISTNLDHRPFPDRNLEKSNQDKMTIPDTSATLTDIKIAENVRTFSKLEQESDENGLCTSSLSLVNYTSSCSDSE